MIPRDSKPSDWGLPFEEWRPHQIDLLNLAMGATPGCLTVIEAPTGIGKSAVVGALASRGPVIGLVATRDLQQQYADSFHGLPIIWGRQHYKCVLPSWVESWKRRYGGEPTKEECPFDLHGSACPTIDACPYEAAKLSAVRARRMVTNYAYAFFAEWWRHSATDWAGATGMPTAVVCDEAHRLPELISSLASLTISGRTLQRFGLPPLPLIGGSTLMALRSGAKWLNTLYNELDVRIARTSDEATVVKLRSLRASVRLLGDLLMEAQPDSWHIVSGVGLGRFEARPVVLTDFLVSRIINQCLPTILMSATIGAPDMLLMELGLSCDFRFKSFPHIFPQERRPVFFYKDAPKIANDSQESAYMKQADIIKRVLSAHTGQRGVIHTTSWKHTETLAKLLEPHFGDRLYIPKGERVTTVLEFIGHGPDTVAISPSWSEGLDFHDDIARFCVVAKVPFPYLGDPVVSLKLKQLGRKWYDWQAALGVIQAVGRIVRHEEDWGISYIVDGMWPRVARLAPSWFEVQVI